MLINNYEKLFLWKTNDKILAFLIKHAQGTRKERERTVRAMKMANIRESKRVASSSTSERTNYTTNSNRNRRLKKKEQIFNVAHRRSNQFAVLVPACVHTLLNFSFFFFTFQRFARLLAPFSPSYIRLTVSFAFTSASMHRREY